MVRARRCREWTDHPPRLSTVEPPAALYMHMKLASLYCLFGAASAALPRHHPQHSAPKDLLQVRYPTPRLCIGT